MQMTAQNVSLAERQEPSKYPNYSKNSSVVLGSLHAIITVVLFIPAVTGIAQATRNPGTMWFMVVRCALYAAASVCTIAAGLATSTGVVIASMVLNIIVAIIAVIYVIICGIAIAAFNAMLANKDNIYDEDHPSDHDAIKIILVLCYVLLFVYLAQAVITFKVSAIGYIWYRGLSGAAVLTTNCVPVVVGPMDGRQTQLSAHVVHANNQHMQVSYPEQMATVPPSNENQVTGRNDDVALLIDAF